MGLQLPSSVPVVQVSIFNSDLDSRYCSELNFELGRRLRPLRKEGVVIMGSGMSFHNMGAFFEQGGAKKAEWSKKSKIFDDWINEQLTSEKKADRSTLCDWEKACAVGKACHPRAEHLQPLLVCAGAAAAGGDVTAVRGKMMGGIHWSSFVFE